jgi:integrase/recombinase XerD
MNCGFISYELGGHSKLETTALYTRVATRTIHAVTGPLDRLMALMEGKPPAG